ncbi:glycosyltransferase family 4 protein [Sabulicella glaciei]|uniref:Glycosyltransferase family 4 protein n=1 Tax=Sabulicella glaciei TaxID=2984948 RepID=A0ABT3NRM0_9PROT|nr:glycosyltransferase family 4 protein [Roseococcus sp. MDT2-1-1]MCW8084801.1 glycosyltransferase family 4 protein [Roseococcus sp. MDT2-1-1]
MPDTPLLTLPRDSASAAPPRPSLPRLLVFSTLYPNAATPNHGVFVENRLRHLVADEGVEARVLAPVPWFPEALAPFFTRWGRAAAVPRDEIRHGLAVRHPRFLALPRLGMVTNPWALYRAARKEVTRMIQAGFDFDVIDAHYLYPDGVAATWLGREFGRPVVITARGSDVSQLPDHAVPRRLIRRAIEDCDALIAVSADLKRGLLALGAPDDKVTVLRNGVELERFRPPSDRAALRRELGVEGILILSVGLLIERKRHHLTIGALKDLPEARLWIAGEGPERASLEALARQQGIADRVRFLGPVPHSELPRFYGAADAMVLASSREGWANVLLESMACGTPVVSTPAWGAREAVCTEAAGEVVDVATPAAIAAALRRVLAEPDRAATRAHAESFGWREVSAGQAEVFRRVLGR